GNIAQGQYYFEAVASDSGSTMWSNDSVNSGMNQTLQVYPQKVNCNIVGANPALYNQTSSYYSGTNPTISEISATCTSDPCGAAQSIFNSESKTNPTQWDYGLQWTPLGSSAGMCEYWEGQSTSPTTPSCDSGYTLCYNSASSTNQPYFCSNGGTCPLDANQNPMNPPTLYDSSGNPTCIVGSGCVNPICTTGSQDSCVSTASCSKTTSGGLCLSNSVVSEQPGTTETAGNTVMAFSSDGVNIGVTLPSGSSYVTGGVTNSLSNGGTVKMTISNTAIAVQLTPAGGSAIPLSSGTVVNTPDSVSVNVGTSAVTSYFPIGTVTTVSGGASTTSTTMLTKTINVNSALSVASSVNVNAGGTSTTSISGGSGSYSISTQPNSAYATASISGSTLTINGVAAGTTSLVVSDGSQTATISITVQSSGGSNTIHITVTPTVTPVNQASEGTTLCMDSTTGALVSFAGTSCPSGTTNAPGSCASSNPSSSTCASGLQCTTSGTGGYCYNPSRTSGKCIYHTTNTGSSCTDGFLNYTWTTSWTETGTRPSWCPSGIQSMVISCPANIPLPFFNVYNAIEVIILVALVYTAIIFAKKRQHKGAIHNSSKKKK
ncbi:MAG: hypothetical protein KGH55_03120, partial [Nanoarchaeota archaeon]|nr:hypothetical protein [Nanoarchaeota archaeon]